jgi:Haem-degrading
MDASPMLASVELAPAKARTAALFAKPSKALEDAIRAGRTAAVTAGFVEMDGGLPLTVNGELVGAIGVSSARPDALSRVHPGVDRRFGRTRRWSGISWSARPGARCRKKASRI